MSFLQQWETVFCCITIIMTNWNQNVLNCRLNVNARSLNGFKYMLHFCFDCFLPHALVNCYWKRCLCMWTCLQMNVTQRSSRITRTNTNVFITASLIQIRSESHLSLNFLLMTFQWLVLSRYHCFLCSRTCQNWIRQPDIWWCWSEISFM